MNQYMPMMKFWIEMEVFQKSPVGMALIESVTGRILHTNEAYCRLLGRDQKSVVGKTWMHFTHPDDVGSDVHYVHEVLSGKLHIPPRTKRYLDDNGLPVCVEVSLYPVSRDWDSVARYSSAIPAARNSSSKIHMTMVVNRNREVTLAERLKSKMVGVHRSREIFCAALAKLTQFRDRETGEHLLRTKAYVRLLLRNLPGGNIFGEHGVRLITRASTLHDIGKVGISDAILLKKGPLSPEESLVMQTHTTLGAEAIRQMIKIGGDDPALVYAMDIALSHHERWDGKGYPNRISREQIPLVACVMALSDVYDALRSERPYKDSMSHAETVKIIRAGAGTQFDPALIRVFDRLEKEFAMISETEKSVLEKLKEEEF